MFEPKMIYINLAFCDFNLYRNIEICSMKITRYKSIGEIELKMRNTLEVSATVSIKALTISGKIVPKTVTFERKIIVELSIVNLTTPSRVVCRAYVQYITHTRTSELYARHIEKRTIITSYVRPNLT